MTRKNVASGKSRSTRADRRDVRSVTVTRSLRVSENDSPWTEFGRWILTWLQVTAMILVVVIMLLWQAEKSLGIPPQICIDGGPAQ
jgi:hypothetical protein